MSEITDFGLGLIIQIQPFSVTLAEMRLNRTLIERSIKLRVCPFVVSPAGGNFASANKPANSAVIKKSYLFPKSCDYSLNSCDSS